MNFVKAMLLVLLLPAILMASVTDPMRVVFLVHGWNGSVDSFGIVPKLLAAEQPGLWPAGYWNVETIAFKAPRPDATLVEQSRACGEKVAAALSSLARKFPGQPREVYFVTHSMGGLIVRQLYLDNREKPGPLMDAFRDLKRAVLVAPPNQGSDEVRFAIYQLEKGLSGLTGDFLSDRALKSLTNKAIGSMLKGLPLEQAYNMAAGSDFIEALNLGWHKAGACETFPVWVLAGAHDVVVDLANANINALQVSPDETGRTRCVRCTVDPLHVRYYPYNHSNTNRRDGILGSIEGVDHPVFADLARILTEKSVAPMPSPVGPSKLFLRFRHPAGDRITDVQVEPFEDALKEAHVYEMSLPDGKVVGFRQKDFVVIAGLRQALMPTPGGTMLTIKVKAERRGILPAFVPYMPKFLKSQQDWGPQNLVKARNFAYRPVQISLPDSSLTTNCVVSLTLPLSESPIDLADAATVIPGGCGGLDGEPAERKAKAEARLAGKDTEELAHALRKLGGTQDPALVDLIAKYTGETFPQPVRRAAVAALGDLRSPDALAPIKALTDSADLKLKCLALDALGRVPVEAAIDFLVEQLSIVSDGKLERAALAGLAQAPEPFVRAAIDKALAESPAPARRSRVTSLALACCQVTPELMGVVAVQALAATDGRAAPDPYGRILDLLVEGASPDDRTWVRRCRKEAGQAQDATWTKKLLVRVAGRVRPADLPALEEDPSEVEAQEKPRPKDPMPDRDPEPAEEQ